MNTPLALLNSDNGMAVKFQKAMNQALAQGDYERYELVGQRLDRAMAAPGFNSVEFLALCRTYGVMV